MNDTSGITAEQTSKRVGSACGSSTFPNGKKTKGRVKIKMEFIDNKRRRYTSFSKRKTGLIKKAYELSTLTGTQVMVLVASETGHVYTFATKKLKPIITSYAGKLLIQTCLNSENSKVQSSQFLSNSLPQKQLAPHSCQQTSITEITSSLQCADYFAENSRISVNGNASSIHSLIHNKQN